MQMTPEVTLREVDRTPDVDEAIEAGVEALEETGERITSCRVVVELPHRRHRSGNAVHVTVDVRLPGIEILVNRPPSRSGPETPQIAITDAFKTARDRLLERTAKRRESQRRPKTRP
jgi:hypothetical protein